MTGYASKWAHRKPRALRGKAEHVCADCEGRIRIGAVHVIVSLNAHNNSARVCEDCANVGRPSLAYLIDVYRYEVAVGDRP